MTQDEARQAIQEHFYSAWGGATPLTPIAWDNKAFDPTIQNDDWVRFSVQFVSGDQASLGTPGDRRFRRFGLIFVQIFTKADAGLVSSDTLGKIAVDAFEGISLVGNLWFRNVGLVTIGVEGKWFQQNISAEFQYDEIK